MISIRDINSIIMILVATYEFDLEKLRLNDEINNALRKRWRFENLKRLFLKWIEQEVKINQILLLLQAIPSINDYNIVYKLFDGIINKKLKMIQVENKMKDLEKDFE
jgi:hypothetical protein